MSSLQVGVVMGSQSDWETMKNAADTLDALDIEYEARIISAHRTPDRLYDFANGAKDEGFKVITDRIQTRKRVNLLWIIGLITFFLSAVLDNLTTTIVMVSLLRKLIRGRPERWLYVGVVVIAANAGGAWSPIGDVTTTMLWIGTQISATGVITGLFLPSLICLLVRSEERRVGKECRSRWSPYH